jgi:hypothetical protein
VDPSLPAVSAPQSSGTSTLSWLLTDAYVVGGVAWVSVALSVLGLLATVVGLWIAVKQIMQLRTAAEAAALATEALIAQMFGRERLIELATAIGHLDTATTYISQRDFRPAILCVDFAHRECVKVTQLLASEPAVAKNVSKLALRLRKLNESLAHADDRREQEQFALTLAIEARSIISGMNTASARLRYNYGTEGKGYDDAS